MTSTHSRRLYPLDPDQPRTAGTAAGTMTRSIALAALLLCASAATALVYGQTQATDLPQLVQTQSTRFSPVSNQQCTLTLSNGISSGDTVVGYVHSTNNADDNAMTPDWIKDNNNVTYMLAGAVEWIPFHEDINIFYLTNVQGNPTSFTFDFSNYPNSGNTVLGPCNVGFAEYSGVGSVVVAGPTRNSGTSPSITISPTSPALIWLFAADFGGGFSSLQNSDYTGIIDNWSTDDIGVWSSNAIVPAGSLTWTVNAPRANQASTILAAVAVQSGDQFQFQQLNFNETSTSP